MRAARARSRGFLVIVAPWSARSFPQASTRQLVRHLAASRLRSARWLVPGGLSRWVVGRFSCRTRGSAGGGERRARSRAGFPRHDPWGFVIWTIGSGVGTLAGGIHRSGLTGTRSYCPRMSVSAAYPVLIWFKGPGRHAMREGYSTEPVREPWHPATRSETAAPSRRPGWHRALRRHIASSGRTGQPCPRPRRATE